MGPPAAVAAVAVVAVATGPIQSAPGRETAETRISELGAERCDRYERAPEVSTCERVSERLWLFLPPELVVLATSELRLKLLPPPPPPPRNDGEASPPPASRPPPCMIAALRLLPLPFCFRVRIFIKSETLVDDKPPLGEKTPPACCRVSCRSSWSESESVLLHKHSSNALIRLQLEHTDEQPVQAAA